MAGGGDCGGSVSAGSESSGVGAGREPVQPWPRIRDGNYFLQETWRRGEPDMRPTAGRIVLARTAGMVALERKYRGRSVLVTVEGERRATAAALLATLQLQCNVRQTAVTVEVTCPPYHFFVRFDSDEDCHRVVSLGPVLRCGGERVRVRRWTRTARGTQGKFEYKCMLSIEGLPEDAWEPHVVNLVLAGLDGELVEMLPATDRWVLPVTAWLRDPYNVPKCLTVTIPAPPLLPAQPSSDEEVESPSPPSSPTEKRTHDYNLLIHVKEVIDRGPLLSDGTGFYPESEEEDLSRRHKFKTWRGKVDGTGPGDHGDA